MTVDYTFKNFAVSTVAGGAGGVGTNLQAGDTSVFVQGGDGSKFTGVSSSAPGYLLLGTVSGTHELCSYTGVSGDQLTGLTRGLEGTSAGVWAPGASIESVVTAGVMGHALFDDGGLLSTNGAGVFTAIKFSAAPTGVGNGTPTLLDMNPAGATINKHWSLLYNGATGALQFFNLTDSLDAYDIQPNGQINIQHGFGILSGVNCAGGFGVAVVAASVKDTSIVANTATNITSFTAPAANSRLLISGSFAVGAGNTNNGTVTFKVTYTDSVLNTAQTAFFTAYGSTTAINGLAETKGAAMVHCGPMPLEVKASTAVTVVYQNSAAGTIADTVSATIEILA